MALELRNRLELNLGVILSATLIWGYPTIAALAPFLLEKMGLSERVTVHAESGSPEPEPAAVSDVAELSEDVAAAMLSEKLASLDAEYQ
jgi:polyketide synthase 12/myxalamid-type polyketide synthase MxaF